MTSTKAASDTTVLLREARSGSREAMEELFRRCGPRLLAIIRLRLGPELRARMESRDILADCLLAAFERLDQLRGDDAPALMTWLARIAENRLRDLADYHHRERRDHRRETDLDDPGSARAIEAAVRSQTSRVQLDREMQRVERALESLSSEHREAILLRKLYEFSFAEMAERLDRTPDACRMLFARAMAALTIAMQDAS